LGNGKRDEVMDNYWKTFWSDHAASTRNDHQQRQVLRTVERKPIESSRFQEILKYVEEKMRVCESDEILDLCCANGLFSTYLAERCKRVVGVDFSKDLTDQIDLKRYKNISIFVKDIREVNFDEQFFDKVLLYAGLQYLSYKETISLFEKVSRWLRNGGIFFVGDVPDLRSIWKFHDSEEREQAYFDSLKNDAPIIGTWFSGDWLKKLGRYAGFGEIDIMLQPDDFPYAHYRFDITLRKK
jgi:cyclopropane fatty-acyl-phospholipid synthase-like methyltransferase